MKTVTRGAGKPALYGKAMERKNVMLDAKSIAFYTKFGKGNLSKGIRQHWRSLTPLALDGAEGCWLCGKPESEHPSAECMSFIRPAANARPLSGFARKEITCKLSHCQIISVTQSMKK